jgi:hypothetical protein
VNSLDTEKDRLGFDNGTAGLAASVNLFAPGNRVHAMVDDGSQLAFAVEQAGNQNHDSSRLRERRSNKMTDIRKETDSLGYRSVLVSATPAQLRRERLSARILQH